MLGTIADHLSMAGFGWGCSSEIDSIGRLIFTAEAYARDGRRFTVLSDEKLSAFLELHTAIPRQPGSVTKRPPRTPADVQLSAPALHLPTPRATG
jgi:hypothetical protein